MCSTRTARRCRSHLASSLVLSSPPAAAEVRDMRDTLGDSEFSSFMSVRICFLFLARLAAASAGAQQVACCRCVCCCSAGCSLPGPWVSSRPRPGWVADEATLSWAQPACLACWLRCSHSQPAAPTFRGSRQATPRLRPASSQLRPLTCAQDLTFRHYFPMAAACCLTAVNPHNLPSRRT